MNEDFFQIDTKKILSLSLKILRGIIQSVQIVIIQIMRSMWIIIETILF